MDVTDTATVVTINPTARKNIALSPLLATPKPHNTTPTAIARSRNAPTSASVNTGLFFGSLLIRDYRAGLILPNVKDEPREGLARLLALQEA